jgi:hypothetical protein
MEDRRQEMASWIVAALGLMGLAGTVLARLW